MRKLLYFIPTVLTLSLIFGILFGYYINPKPIVILIGLLATLVLLGIAYWHANKLYQQKYYFNIVAYFLFFMIGVGSITKQNIQFQKKHYSHFITKENTLILTINKQLKSNPYYHKYYASLSQLDTIKVTGNILLNIKNDSITNRLKVGDKIQVKAIFKPINQPLNLYQFNYRDYLKKQQIHHQITSTKNEIITLPSSTITINKIAFSIRQKINIALAKYDFKKEELAIINALLLGQRQNVSKELLQSYAGAGAMHLLAVSGLHIGILLLLLNMLFKPLERLKKGKTIKLILVIFLLWIYAIIAGLSPSIIRATGMFTAIAIGLLSNKKTNTLHNLFISMFFLLLVNPLYLFSVGFQLSYLAVFSIVYIYPVFIQWYNPQQWFIKKVWQLLAISFSAQLGVLPISLYYFHQFPSLFFISSLVIIPLLGFILALGIVVIILAVLGILPQILANLFGLIISKMNAFISFIAKQETFLFQQINYSILLLIASYFIIIFGFRFLKIPDLKKLRFVLLGIILFQTVVIYEKRQCNTTKEFIVFNKNKASIIIDRNGKNGTVYHNLDSISIAKNRILQNYKVGVVNLDYNYNPINNTYKINKKEILIIDSLGIYKLSEFYPEIVLLRQSPKINLERLIKTLKPKIIIADASNYKTYKKQWKKTCLKHKVNFYNTAIDGAYRYKY